MTEIRLTTAPHSYFDSLSDGPIDPKLLIIGRGRLAGHFCHYLSDLGVSYQNWSRSDGPDLLIEKSQTAKSVVLLVPDRAVAEIAKNFENEFSGKLLIHFSASLRVPGILGFHPLGTFAPESPIEFRRIHFHGPHPESLFREALPFLPNTYRELSPEEMQVYHALCVVGSNFSAILWKAFFREMNNLGVAKEACQEFFQSFASNVQREPEKCVTGPLLRRDQETMERNLVALKHFPQLQGIYKCFVQTFKEAPPS